MIFLCPITGKDFKWFRNWCVKRRIPGAPTFVRDFSSPDFFPRPFSLFPAPTNCPWVSEDGVFALSGNFSLVQKFQSAGSLFIFLGKAWKQLGHVHKFARYLLHRYLKRNGKSVRNDNL